MDRRETTDLHLERPMHRLLAGDAMNTRAMVSTALLAGCAALCGCVAVQQQPPPPSSGWASVEERRITDAQIIDVLRRELWQDAAAGREMVRLRSVGGIVTLSGTVSTRLAQLRAVEIAHVVRGVRGVVDRIVVACPPRPERELEQAVSTVLERDPVTADLGLAVHASAEVVMLSGVVGSNATRRAAEEDALSVMGVREVVDHLAVVPGARSDARLRAEATRVIRQDAWVDSSRLSIDASAGVVRLSGQVDSEVERARAQNDARAATPLAVDIGALRVVRPPADDGTLRAVAAEVPRDADIAETVAEVYSRDARLRTSMPLVEVRDGVVFLGGYTASAEAARAAEDDARNVLGVTDVRAKFPQRPSIGVTMMQGR